VVTDKKIGQSTASLTTDAEYYTADVLSSQDYYAFGAPMPGRNFNSNASSRGFGGQLKDDEISGSGNMTTAEYWEYDTRLGRRWNIDPITYAWQSPYEAFYNNPIVFTDPSGLKGEKKKETNSEGTRNPETNTDHGERFYKRDDKVTTPNTRTGSVGLTTDMLRVAGRENGITGFGINFSRKVGKAFEQLALIEFMEVGKQIGHSTPDRFAKYGVGATTIPDATDDISIYYSEGNKFGKRTIPNASIYEVKAYKGALRLSSSRGQIKAIIDIAARANNNLGGLPASVTFITTSDTKISDDVLIYASEKNVNLFQSTAALTVDGNIIFSSPMELNYSAHPAVPFSLHQINMEYPPAFLGGLNLIPENPNDPDPEQVE
jgi:RHS repeat-associated protein